MKSETKGFSIIEVVLVLGIAALIFMMAFIALPNLWASERDAERRTKVMEFISDLKTYQTNNSRGALPTKSGSGVETFTWNEARSTSTTSDWKGFIKDYVSGDFKDASGSDIKFYITECLSKNGKSLKATQVCAYDAELSSVNSGITPNVGVNNTLYVLIGATCDGDKAVKSSNDRDIAALYVLERSGRYCYNS